MKVLAVLALAFATVSAGIMPQVVPVHPRDLPEFASIEGRITNGKPAEEKQFPYQVGLGFTSPSGGWWCGGSIISNEWVLTAAHCTSGAAGVTIYYGARERTTAKLILTVSRDNFIQHAQYNPIYLNNDISLIRTSLVTFDDYVKKIELPAIAATYPDYAGQQATASGWGKTSDEETSVTNTLQYNVFTVVSVKDCQITYGPLTATDDVICIYTGLNTSTCSGDSGGPLMLNSNNKLIGVTSFVSIFGCESGSPAGFSRVTSYLQWIKDNSGISY